MFVPLVNLVMIFVLGAKGSRWAWQNVSWRDAEHFKRVQRNWAIAGFALFVVGLLSIAAIVVAVPRLMKTSDAYHMTMDAVRADDRVKAAIGNNLADNYWIGGSVNVDADGTGEARYSIPIHGDKGKGTAYSHAVRTAGKWSMRLLVVQVEGADAPIVLVNEDNEAIPNAAIGI